MTKFKLVVARMQIHEDDPKALVPEVTAFKDVEDMFIGCYLDIKTMEYLLRKGVTIVILPAKYKERRKKYIFTFGDDKWDIYWEKIQKRKKRRKK